MKRIIALALLASSVLFAGCASNLSGRDYSAYSVRQKMTVEEGVVDSTRQVPIAGARGPGNGVGSLAGAAVGALVGAGHGGGLGSLVLSVGGAVVGGIIGNIVEHKAREADGIEITIRLDAGNLIAVTQASDTSEPFNKGDHVRILTTANGTSRVTHAS